MSWDKIFVNGATQQAKFVLNISTLDKVVVAVCYQPWRLIVAHCKNYCLDINCFILLFIVPGLCNCLSSGQIFGHFDFVV